MIGSTARAHDIKVILFISVILLATGFYFITFTPSTSAVGTWGGQDTYRLPVAWCVVRGSPAQSDPNIPNPWGGFDRTTDEILWRRHERVTDNIYLAQAGITFRSNINPAIHASFQYKPIDDPGIIGQPGDLLQSSLDPSIPTEYVRMQHACKDIWTSDTMGGEFPGIMALNIRLFVDRMGIPLPLDGELGVGLCKESFGSNLCRAPYEAHVAVVDNYFTIPGVSSGRWNNDPMDQTLGHEIGHALSLNHRNDVTALMYPSQQLDSGGQVYNKLFNSQEVIDIRGPVNSPARLIPGTEIDPPNTVLGGDVVRSIKVDRLGESNNTLPYQDLASVEVTLDKRNNSITFGHELAGLIPDSKHRINNTDYWTLVDIDNNITTGGNETILKKIGVPFVNYSGVDLAMVSQVTGSNITNGININGSAWFTGNNNTIPLPANHTKFDIQTLTIQGHYVNGTQRIRIYDTVNIILNNTGQFMNSSEPLIKLEKPFLLHAFISSIGSITDKLDENINKSRPLRLSQPLYPQCYIENGHVIPGQNITTNVSGLLPNSKIYLQIGDRPITEGVTNSSGSSTIKFTVPLDTTPQLHLVTIGVENTSLTADCELDVKSKGKTDSNNSTLLLN